MEEALLISICIPAYKRVSFLKRLLDSIHTQTYRNFEVVLTDDSPDNDVFELCKSHPLAGSIRYFKNERNLGTPENWNESIRRAGGSWIKLMHDDDWFAGPDALASFVGAIRKSPGHVFFYSGYINVFLENKLYEQVRVSRFWQMVLNRNAKNLVYRNIIGPPSVTIYKRNANINYDPSLKWLVDIDFYMRYLEHSKPVLITGVLVEVGMSAEQVTRAVFRNPEVEIPENLYLLQKMGVRSLKNIFIFDAYWRFIRNLKIRTVSQVGDAGYSKPLPATIESMISFQSRIPGSILKMGLFSKFLMSVYYLTHYSKLSRG